MKRKWRFLIGFFAAAITFSSLMVFVGPRCHNYSRHAHPHHQCSPAGGQTSHTAHSVHML